jgi:hypothetical protein
MNSIKMHIRKKKWEKEREVNEMKMNEDCIEFWIRGEREKKLKFGETLGEEKKSDGA